MKTPRPTSSISATITPPTTITARDASAADQAVATHNAAAAWNRALLENAARPSGALVYDAGAGGGFPPTSSTGCARS
jgi:hypothetical protein